MFKTKRENKSKEQLVFEREQLELAKRRKEFIDIKFIPFLESLDNDLERSTQLCETLRVAINQAFQNLVKTMKVSELELEKKMTGKPELIEQPKQLLNILADQTLDDAVVTLEALTNEVNRVLWEKGKGQKLKEFNQKDDNQGKN